MPFLPSWWPRFLGGGRSSSIEVLDADASDATEDSDVSNGFFEEVDPVKLGDTPNMKRVLDEVACNAILEGWDENTSEADVKAAEDAGDAHVPPYTETHTIANVKVILGSLAVVASILAQFWPGKFPANYTMTAVWVITYAALSTALTVYSYFCESEAVLFAKSNQKSGSSVVVATRLMRFSDVYRIQISKEFAPMDKPLQPLLGLLYPPGSGGPIVDAEWRLGDLFDVDGMLDTVATRKRIRELMRSFEAASSGRAVEPKKSR
ncbi:signal peptidase complex subunit 2 [Pycnococcus provasolii]